MTSTDEQWQQINVKRARRKRRERRAGLLPHTQTARAECGAGYLLLTAGEDGNWRSEGQKGALVVQLRVRGERSGG